MAVDVEHYYRAYGPMVLRRCRSLLKDEARAAETMQDVFVEVLRRQDALVDAAPSSLLYRIATNLSLNRLRTQRRKPETRDEALLLRIAVAPEEENLSITRQLLELVFKQEKESTRTIAVLHLVDGMTLQEVADEVGLSVSGVRKRLRQLKAHVAELEDV